MKPSLISALVVLMAVCVLPMALQPVSAQSLENCYEDIYAEKTIQLGPGAPSITMDVVVDKEFIESCNFVGDDRVNQDNYSAAAIYCETDGVAIWDINDISQGEFGFLVTYGLIDATPADPSQNLLIVEHRGFRFYRLTSGELQLNSPPDWEGKEYVFTWKGCDRPAA